MAIGLGVSGLFHDFKHVFADTAEGAYPIVGNILKCGSGSDASVGITYFGVIDPLAYSADVFVHNKSVCGYINMYH